MLARLQERCMHMSKLEISDYQQRLVKAIWFEQDNGFNREGLAIYRANIKASAVRSLNISYPVVCSLLGQRFFDVLVVGYLRNHPLVLGDWGLWGKDFAAWLKQQDSLSDYPYLHDCALLDWQCHLVEREQNHQHAILKNELIPQQLDRVCLQYAVGTQIIQSNYPIVDIWLAHQTSDATKKAKLLERSRQKLLDQQGQNALIWRPRWKVKVRNVTAPEIDWVKHSSTNNTLSACLQPLSNSNFSLIDWLPKAFSEGLVYGFVS